MIKKFRRFSNPPTPSGLRRDEAGDLNLQDRTNLDSALTSRFQARMVRISGTLASVSTNFVPGSNSGAPNFYGEFDSGSERTLAAWIRHASRTLDFP